MAPTIPNVRDSDKTFPYHKFPPEEFYKIQEFHDLEALCTLNINPAYRNINNKIKYKETASNRFLSE